MKRSNELQGEEYFRKRIEKRSIRLHISNTIPESFRFFVSPRKNLNFLRKIQSRRLARRCLQGIENYLSWQLVAGVNSNFLNPRKVTVGIMAISSELFVGFRILKSLLVVSGKWQVWRHVEEVWTSFDFARFKNSSVDNHGLGSRYDGKTNNSCRKLIPTKNFTVCRKMS